ncbi:nuclear transport factor 2 family protein [Dactylosporangium sp. NPDC005572]|uniref:nuclear transport factor 2 family protein n=1 Tax=Dactylosporangium sp. NPDC005572 TaxID=3156889 RepID=UPI0033B720BA
MSAVDAAFLRDFADRWHAAWNSRETDAVLGLLHPDVLWDERIFWPHPINGREAVRSYVDAIWRAMPEYELSEIQLFTAVDDGRALFMFRQRGAAPAGLGTDRRFDTHGCDIFLEFRDGLLSHYTAAFEITDMLRQVGALPPRGDLKGGAYLLSLTGPRRLESTTPSDQNERMTA